MDYKKLDVYNNDDIERMSKLATDIVREHYYDINGKEQTDYMVEKFQSIKAIKEQIAVGYKYFFVCDEGEEIGFLAYYVRENDIYLSKFYLEKDVRGRGISRNMLSFVINQAKNNNRDKIQLNVNKYNFAVAVYEKIGFVKVRDEILDVGNGYVMDDYVLEYRI